MRELGTHPGRTDSTPGVAITPDGKHAISMGLGGARLWDLESGACLRSLTGPGGTFALHPDGRHAVTCGAKGIALWDLEACDPVETHAHDNWVRVIAIQPGGRRIISAGFDGRLKVWDAETGRCLHSLQHSQSEVKGLALHPDGRRAASCGSDELKLWDLDTGKLVWSVRQRGTWGVVFHPDGLTALSGGSSQTLHITDVETGQCVKTKIAGEPGEGGRSRAGVVAKGGDRLIRLVLAVP